MTNRIHDEGYTRTDLKGEWDVGRRHVFKKSMELHDPRWNLIPELADFFDTTQRYWRAAAS